MFIFCTERLASALATTARQPEGRGCGQTAYQITTDKSSGIRNNPNDWGGNPRYIIDWVKRIVRVSVETVQIVDSLPGNA